MSSPQPTEQRALAVIEASVTPALDFNREQLDILRQTVAAGTSDLEFKLFIEVAKRLGLDPFMRQVHAIMRNVRDGDRWVKRMTIQTGIDGYRVLASRTQELAGIDDAEFGTEDEAGHPAWARVTVWRFVRGTRIPFTATARWREYVQVGRDGQPSGLWAKMPYNQLAKCAEALALRRGFPVELSGLYTNEEMQQADNPLPVAMRPTARVTEATESSEPSEPSEPHAAAPDDPRDDPTADPTQALITEGQRASILKLCQALGKPEPQIAWDQVSLHQAKNWIAALSQQYQTYKAAETAKRTNGTNPTSAPGPNLPAPTPPATPPAKPKAEKPWNGLADVQFRSAIKALGYVSVAQTETFLANAKRFAPNLPDGSREQAKAYLQMVKADAARAAAGGDVGDAESDAPQGYEPSEPQDAADAADDADDGDPGPSDGVDENEELAYDLRRHPTLSGQVSP